MKESQVITVLGAEELSAPALTEILYFLSFSRKIM